MTDKIRDLLSVSAAAAAIQLLGLSTALAEVRFDPVECWFSLPRDQPVECGYLTVPEDREAPDGPEIRIAVVVLRHPGGDPEPDPILRLHGGPGGGYLSYMEVAWLDDAALFGANRDIIAFDQRGQGMSEPSLDCPEISRAYFEANDYEIAGERLSAEGFLDYLGAQIDACYDRVSQSHNLSNYDTAANAADAADLMAALGYETYNIHGSSYGTTLALAMMRRHPEGIRSVILDAPSPPGEAEASGLVAMRHAFEEVLATCAADAACAAAFPDLRETWLETLARLDADPPLIEAVDDYTGERFQVLLNAANATMPLRFSLASASAVRTVPLYVYSLSEGNFDLAARGWGGVLARAGSFLGWGSSLSVRCAEPGSIDDPAAVERLVAESPTIAAFYDHGPLGGRMKFVACKNWPVERVSDEEMAPVRSDIPTLMLVGQVDAATAFEDAQEIAANLTRVHGMYVFPALGHIVGLGSHDCPAEIEAAFLNDPIATPDTSCIAEMAPLTFLTELATSGEVSLVAYEGTGYAGLVPAGWNELRPGVFARSDPSVDKTLYLQLSAPAGEADDMALAVLADFGITNLPDQPMRRISGEGLTWDVFVPAGVVPIIVARAETDAAGYLAVLVASRGEIDGLAESLLIPALEALEPAM